MNLNPTMEEVVSSLERVKGQAYQLTVYLADLLIDIKQKTKEFQAMANELNEVKAELEDQQPIRRL